MIGVQSLEAKYFSLCILLSIGIWGKATKAEVSVTPLTQILNLSDYSVVALWHCDYPDTVLNSIKAFGKFNLTVETYDLQDEKSIDNFFQFRSYFRNALIDLDCFNSENVLERATNLKSINESVHYFLLGSDFNQSVELIKNHDVQINSRITLIINTDDDTYEIFQVHSPGLRRSRKISFIPLGQCISSVCELKKFKINYNMEGTYLDVAFVLPKTPPGEVTFKYAMEFDRRDFRYNFIRSPNPLVKLISEYFNFKIHWIRVENWGYILEDNFTYNGAMGMMQRKELDMIATTYIYTMPRALYIDSGLEGPQLIRQKFVFMHPHSGKGVSGNRNPFIRPLSTGVWVSIAVTVMLGFVTMLVVLKYENHFFHNEIINSALDMIGILAQQGFYQQFRTIYFKVTVFTMLVLSFFLFQFYSASIVGALLTPFPKTIKTADHLMNSDLKVVLENVASARHMLKMYTTELYHKKSLEGKTQYNIPDGLKLVRKGGTAFFVYIDTAREMIKKTFTEEEIKDLQEVNFVEHSFIRLTIFPVIKHAPWREVIRVANRKVIEVGLSDYLNKLYIAKRPFGNDNQMVADVNLGQVSTLLYLLAFGFLLSFSIFLGEVMTKKKEVLKLILKEKLNLYGFAEEFHGKYFRNLQKKGA